MAAVYKLEETRGTEWPRDVAPRSMKGHRFLIARSIALPSLLLFIPRPFPTRTIIDRYYYYPIFRQSFRPFPPLLAFVLQRNHVVFGPIARESRTNSRESECIYVTGYLFGSVPSARGT